MNDRLVRAVLLSYPYLGLKPQAESYYPFGISPQRSAGTDPLSVTFQAMNYLATFILSLRDKLDADVSTR